MSSRSDVTSAVKHSLARMLYADTGWSRVVEERRALPLLSVSPSRRFLCGTVLTSSTNLSSERIQHPGTDSAHSARHRQTGRISPSPPKFFCSKHPTTSVLPAPRRTSAARTPSPTTERSVQSAGDAPRHRTGFRRRRTDGRAHARPFSTRCAAQQWRQ